MLPSIADVSVLIADDDADSREFLETALELAGAIVRAAVDGERALDVLAFWKPDVLLLDLTMPRMNGFEVLAIVRDNDALRSIPAIAVTASVFPKHRAQGAAAGFDAFVAKPVDVDELIEVIAALTRSWRPSR